MGRGSQDAEEEAEREEHDEDPYRTLRIPDPILAWLLLRRSGLSRTQQSIVIASNRNRFTLAGIEESLRTQDWTRDAVNAERGHRGRAHGAYHADDDSPTGSSSDGEWFTEDNHWWTQEGIPEENLKARVIHKRRFYKFRKSTT